MLLENIKNFTWYNEPQNFSFSENGLQVETCPGTDFWQNIDNGFSKDNGHLFVADAGGGFILEAKWKFSEIKDAAQCGIIIRADSQNWLKVGLLSPNHYHPQVGVVIANQGSSDWSMHSLPDNQRELWFRIKRLGRDFIVSYSLNGQQFEQLRMSHLAAASGTLVAGAYACSPQKESFCCLLEEISLNHL